MFAAILDREIRLASRNQGAWLNPLVFAIMVLTLFSFGIGPDETLLSSLGPAIIWVIALLAVMLSLEALFSRDFDDGSLEQMLLSGFSSYGIALAKILAHWLVVGLPLTLAAPLYVLMLGLPLSILPILSLGLIIGVGILCFLGAVGAAVTMSLRSGGAIVALVVLPFYIPVIIFGASLFQEALWSTAASGEAALGAAALALPGLLLLAGMLLLVICLCPFAVAWGLELGVEEA